MASFMAAILTRRRRLADSAGDRARQRLARANRRTIVLCERLRPRAPPESRTCRRRVPPTKPRDVGRSGLPAILIEHETVPLVTGPRCRCDRSARRRLNCSAGPRPGRLRGEAAREHRAGVVDPRILALSARIAQPPPGAVGSEVRSRVREVVAPGDRIEADAAPGFDREHDALRAHDAQVGRVDRERRAVSVGEAKGRPGARRQGLAAAARGAAQVKSATSPRPSSQRSSSMK